MFKYLLSKALLDSLGFFCSLFETLYRCESCAGIPQSYVMQLWYVTCYYFINYVAVLAAGFLEVAATVDCYLTINKKLDCCRSKTSFYLVLFACIVSSTIFFIPKLFYYDIVEMKTANNNRTVFQVATSFYHSQADTDFRFVETLTREIGHLPRAYLFEHTHFEMPSTIDRTTHQNEPDQEFSIR